MGAFGKLDIVFANAGIGGTTPIGGTSLDTFQQIITTNLTSVFFTIQAVAPHLSDKASIILNGSVHAVMGVPLFGSQCRTCHKGAVRSMTRVLASEFAQRNPGQSSHSRRDTHRNLKPAGLECRGDGRAGESAVSNTISIGRMGRPEEVARTVLFLRVR